MQLYRTPGPMGERYIQAHDLEIPEWIEEITDSLYVNEDVVWVSSIKDIVQGGCASGSYMPAVTYCDAMKTMGQYGDEVLQYIWEQLGDVPQYDQSASCFGWAEMAVFYLSTAVELWAGGIMAEVEEADEEVNQ